ncbi:MAG: hypothetical protein KIS63_13025 [Caldilineales bacterium]|nr:hypothetical protein [Caldilineales bacterium]
MLSLSSIYQTFRKGNHYLTTTQRFALVTVAAMTGHYGWLKLTPAELGDNLGVERRSSYRLIAWMKEIGFLLPVDVLYDRKQVNHVFICGLPIEQSDVDNALPHIQKHFTVTNRKKTLTVVPTVTVEPMDVPGLPTTVGAVLPGAKLHPSVDPSRPRPSATTISVANAPSLPRKKVPPMAQNDMQKSVTHDTNRRKVSPVAQNNMQKSVTGDTTYKFVPSMTLTPQGDSDDFSDLFSTAANTPYLADTAAIQASTPITAHAANDPHAPKNSVEPGGDLTAVDGVAILGAGEKRNRGSQRSVTTIDPINTTTIGGGDGGDVPDTFVGESALSLLEEGGRVYGEKAGQNKKPKRPPKATQQPLLPKVDADPAVVLVSRWLQIIHATRPAEPELSRDYLQPARELLTLTAGDVEEAITLLNARRTQFIEAGYKSARKLSTIGGAIVREAEAEQIAARAATDPINSLFALPVPPQTTY